MATRVLQWAMAVLWLLTPQAVGRRHAKKKPARPHLQAVSWEEWSEAARRREPVDDEGAQQLGCTIERRALGTLTQEEFLREYHLQKPVLITGATAQWTDAFTPEALRERHSQLEVLATQSFQIRNYGMSDPTCPAVRHVPTTLGSFLANGLQLTAEETPPGAFSDKFYVFDSSVMRAGVRGKMPAGDLRQQVLLPSVFHDPGIDLILAVGGNGSGTQFHRHTDAWNVLVSGHKRWFLTPGERIPLPSYPASYGMGIEHYVAKLFPALTDTEQPQHCVQRPGELMYVPEGWFHATYNLNGTIAIAGQNLTRGPSSDVYRRHFKLHSAKTVHEKLTYLAEIEAAQPTHQGVHFLRATSLHEVGQTQQAVAELRKSLAQSPGHSDSHLKLGQFLLIEAVDRLMTGNGPPSPAGAQDIVVAFETAFALNPLDFLAADGLVVAYGLSGPRAQELKAKWLRRRDEVLAVLGISLQCASKQPLLSVVWQNDLQQHASGGIPALLTALP